MAKDNELIGRREFFGSVLNDLKYLAGSVLRAATQQKKFIRPPGAIEEAAFLAGCQRCGRCYEVCPQNSILIAGPDQGIALGTPYLKPAEQPCTFCFKCIESCPNGVLRPQGRVDGIGTAIIDPARCLAYHQQLCSSCVYACPADIKAILKIDFQYPKVDPNRCIGCGQCAKVCIAPESAIDVVPRNNSYKTEQKGRDN